MFKKISGVFWVLSVCALVTAYSVGAAPPPQAQDEDYDRLDGTGRSGKKVNVIEWEGNLEIHVYPGGSLKGLALKLDKRNKDKPVMVIGYRFEGDPKVQLVRRAILGIELKEGFKAYRDPSAGSEYDKVIISNNGLSGLVAFRLEPELTQLYPDGDSRLPASAGSSVAAPRAAAPEVLEDPGVNQETGAIKPFDMRADRMLNRP
jgi:hypothetical protein